MEGSIVGIDASTWTNHGLRLLLWLTFLLLKVLIGKILHVIFIVLLYNRQNNFIFAYIP